MIHTIERRAQASGSTFEAEPPRASSRSIQAKRSRPQATGLTRRERRVQAILLKELERMNGKQFGSGLTYAEKQRLEKTIDAAFIDRELEKMYRQHRWLPRLLWGAAALFVVLGGLGLWFALQDGTAAWGDLFYLAPIISGIISPFIQLRALRRKIFIYEALRELSDADEIDVTLGRVVEEADALIDRIVERELALTNGARRMQPHRT